MLGLALSGGAARTMGHLGVLKVLERENIQVDAIAGCSGGSIVGALYCTGRYTSDELIEIAEKIKWYEFFRPVWPPTALISSSVIYDYIYKFIGELTFEELKIPLAVTATDFQTGDKVVISSGPIAPAIQASCSLPVIFSPVKLNGKILIDGGFSSQIPALALKENLKCSNVIAVDVNFDCSKPVETYRNIFRVFYHFLSIPSIVCSRYEKQYADIIIEVSARDLFLYNYNKIDLMVKRGILATELQVDNIKDL